ncbi:nucleosome assembly protein [Schizosaccharomyces japonicus yFS275]|uniref:Nucleosome assembly protein n=1 Tax=Schizosaccharomyces japonicus (strain yFS275 / FY16936) TaxID=402676 RepID=B6JXN0_SCHJY|nr:nucleosome assembly protein [Schizosaccharomyces japonicus yFS275]EEB05174.1 nucleosome assembly protein [Schizosaccharomyces japonicus yFS275]
MSEADAKAFEELADLEHDFGKAELEILKKQNEVFKPLFAKRRDILKNIKNFWVIVLEAAGDEISQYITPDDSVLLENLQNLYVERPDENEPRNLRITMSFLKNDFLQDDSLTLEKNVRIEETKELDEEGLEKTTTRYVSEPVKINWKAGKSLNRKNKNSPPGFFDFFEWTGEEDREEFDGAELAIFLAEDLFPNAVKYFTETMSEELGDDDESSVDLEEDEEEEDDEDEASEKPPAKRSRKSD